MYRYKARITFPDRSSTIVYIEAQNITIAKNMLEAQYSGCKVSMVGTATKVWVLFCLMFIKPDIQYFISRV
jgi:hypothetical protein